MCKFEQILISRPPFIYYNLHYIPDVERCYRRYYKYLQDDFSQSYVDNIISLIQEKSPYFWVILDQKDIFKGFVYLDNFIGDEKTRYSAELTTCYDRKAWGIFTRYSAKFFLKACFDKLGLQKIKAQIYPDNHRVKTLLKSSGFVYETVLKNETLRGGKPQDIEVYSLYKDYYCKTR